MKVLVTGGAGFIGHHLIKKLFVESCKITSYDNYSTGKKENEIVGVQYVNVPLNDSRMFNLENFDIVFHLAALARIQPSFLNPVETINNNYLSTLNIINLCHLRNIPVVYAGSSSFHHGKYLSPYAFSKRAGENLFELFSRTYHLNCATTRFYNVYGPKQIESGDYATVIGIFEKQYRENQPFTIVGHGKQKRDFTHVKDIVNGLYQCGQYLLNRKTRTYYEFELGRGRNHSINEVANMFSKDHPKEYLPSRQGEYDKTLADFKLAKSIFDYNPKENLEDYVESVK